MQRTVHSGFIGVCFGFSRSKRGFAEVLSGGGSWDLQLLLLGLVIVLARTLGAPHSAHLGSTVPSRYFHMRSSASSGRLSTA